MGFMTDKVNKSNRMTFFILLELSFISTNLMQSLLSQFSYGISIHVEDLS